MRLTDAVRNSAHPIQNRSKQPGSRSWLWSSTRLPGRVTSSYRDLCEVLHRNRDLAQAFDRLEVAKFSATALIDTSPIGDDEWALVEEKFGLGSIVGRRRSQSF